MNRKKQNTPIDLSSMVYGKVPPQAKELEEAILGAILLEGMNAFDIAAGILKPESFYVDAHQRIFRAMLSLSLKSHPIDMLTVAEQLKASNELETIGGPFTLTNLTKHISSSAHILAHSRIVHEKFKIS